MKPKTSSTLPITALIAGIGFVVTFMFAFLAVQRGRPWLADGQSAFDIVIGGLTLAFAVAAGWVLYRRALAAEKSVEVAQSTEINGQFAHAIDHISSSDEAANIGGAFTLLRIAHENGEPFVGAAFDLLHDKLLSVCREESLQTWGQFNEENAFFPDHAEFKKPQNSPDCIYPASTPLVPKILSFCIKLWDMQSGAKRELTFTSLVLSKAEFANFPLHTLVAFENVVLINPVLNNMTFGRRIHGLALDEVKFSRCTFDGTHINLRRAPNRTAEPQAGTLALTFQGCRAVPNSRTPRVGCRDIEFDCNGNARFELLSDGWEQIGVPENDE